MLSLVERLKGLGHADASTSDIRITFSLPTPVSSEAPPNLAQLNIGKPDADHNGALEYVGACRREARALSRCTLPAARRLQLTEEFAAHFVLIAAKYIRTHADDGGIPDSDRRKDLLDTTATVIGYLIDSYKVAFRKLYDGTSGSPNSRRELKLSAFRILELTKLLQRVLGLRYPVWSGPAWLTVNTVYHAMRVAGRGDAKIAPLETGLPEDEDSPRRTIAGMFLTIQMIARFDVLRWPTELQQFCFAYGKSVRWLGEIVEDNHQPLPRNVSVAHCYDTHPARTTRPGASALLGPSVLIDWSKLVRKMTTDMIAFFGATAPSDLSYFQKRLDKMSYNGRLALVQLQFDAFTNERQHLPVDAGSGQACDMRIFIGFRSVYQLLQNNQMGKYGAGTRLDDALAKRSAVFADDNVATVESAWFLQYEDNEILRLKTQESKFTTSMRIGTMAAYGVGNDGIANPRFGMIARIFRPSPQAVIVDIVKHGEYVEPVVVSPDANALDNAERDKERTAGLVLGAIIVRSAHRETKLLLPPLSTLRESAALTMKRQQAREAIRLGKLQSVTHDFFLFRLA